VQFLYARVSTSDQTAAHQLEQARAAGFEIEDENVIEDAGVSGVSTRFAEREGGRRLLDKLRTGDTLVVRWVDRLGRNYEDVVDTIQALMRRGVIVRTVINNMTFDGATKDPMQKAVRDALIAFMAALGQAAVRGHEARPAGRYRPRAGQRASRLSGAQADIQSRAACADHGSARSPKRHNDRPRSRLGSPRYPPNPARPGKGRGCVGGMGKLEGATSAPAGGVKGINNPETL